MEDSYTVHRRRKAAAAARRREKTPEPGFSRQPSNEEETEETMDEDEERRARMERMVADTERLEKEGGESDERPRSRTRQLDTDETTKARSKSPAVNRPEVTEEAPVKIARKHREPGESGTELRRRMGSPEAAKLRSERHLSPTTSSARRSPLPEPLPEEEQPDIRPRKRVSSRHRHSEEEEEPPPPLAKRSPPRSRRSPSTPAKKQIIPLSDECLIEDVARAKRAYSHREPIDDYEYEDDEDDDEEEEEEEEYIPRRRREPAVRRRKTSVTYSEEEKKEISNSVDQPSSWFSWIPWFGRRKQKVDESEEDDKKKVEKEKKEKKEEKEKKEKKEEKEKKDKKNDKEKKDKEAAKDEEEPVSDKVTIRDFFRSMMDLTSEFSEFCRQNPQEVQILVDLRNLCIVETIITLIICGLGGLAFRFTEGAFETFYKCGVKRVKRDFLDSLWNYSHSMREDDWKSMARRKLMEFEEQLHEANEAGVQTYSGQKNWNFLNSVVYCLTVVTTIGYGHISPNTTTGRALTIIYAIFGIPMFLIVLADFGKLFTRCIKFFWAFVRRVYYTGSCRKVRRTVQVQEMMKGVQMVYDLAKFRRPSQLTPEELEEIQRQQQQQTPQQPESPSTPAMSTFEIDDEFNLPISVAIIILVVYIFIGATVFNIIEDWSFFESFYFVFISMSTIGFGDFVPNDPLYMMLSIVYLIFGLALTSMCINVVQVMLADQFKQASQKIGASIGLRVSEEDGSLKPAPPEAVEIADVHISMKKPEDGKNKVAPKAKQEDIEL